jgi:hypothetical protein
MCAKNTYLLRIHTYLGCLLAHLLELEGIKVGELKCNHIKYFILFYVFLLRLSLCEFIPNGK